MVDAHLIPEGAGGDACVRQAESAADRVPSAAEPRDHAPADRSVARDVRIASAGAFQQSHDSQHQVAEPDNHYGIVVGIEHYSGRRPPVDLPSAIADAQAVHEWLADGSVGGRLPEKQLVLITSVSRDNPVQDHIDDALEALLEQASTSGGAQRFYLYFAGHGVAAEPDSIDLCLGKWSRRRRNMSIATAEYLNYLAKTATFPEIVSVFDCCRTYLPAVRGLHPTLGVERARDGAHRVRSYLATATEYTQMAYEIESPEVRSVDPTSNHGFFTLAILEGLRGAALCQAEGGVSFPDLASYVEPRVQALGERYGRPQRPIFDGPARPAGKPPLVLGFANPTRPTPSERDTTPVTVRFTPGRVSHRIELVGPSGTTIHQHRASAEAWLLELEMALHLLRDVDAGDERSINLRSIASGGGPIDVDF